MTSKLYVHQVLSGLSLSQLRQLAREFNLNFQWSSKERLIAELLIPNIFQQNGGADPVEPTNSVDYWLIGSRLEALLLSIYNDDDDSILLNKKPENIPIEQIKTILDEAGIEYDYSPEEWYKILLPQKIMNDTEPPYYALSVFVNSLNKLQDLKYTQLKLLNSYYPKTLVFNQNVLKAKQEIELSELMQFEPLSGLDLEELSNLETLDIRDTFLESLPDSIGALSNLKFAELSRNKLKSLPESIGALSKLRLLNLNNNPLKSLPESIGALTNLDTIYLYRTDLISLPESIGNLSNLKKLYLYNTPLKSIPKSIKKLTNLKDLRLH